ncbi:MAG: PadR family transcriptional regulator [Saprospiraceae bacterium]|nr:helix-turn-helix transcriptional regulator [Bacteroidia bacterium]NNF20824.1 PadR family transcriptional regulator [Saprospiraceae bacterium]
MNHKLFRGSLDTIIIKLLSDNGPMYGYEITQKVKVMTSSAFKITEGALYPALHRLENKGLLDTETKNIGNRFRKYYTLTESGIKESSQMLEDMQAFIRNIQIIMNPAIN